jgi:hypothetical protein
VFSGIVWANFNSLALMLSGILPSGFSNLEKDQFLKLFGLDSEPIPIPAIFTFFLSAFALSCSSICVLIFLILIVFYAEVTYKYKCNKSNYFLHDRRFVIEFVYKQKPSTNYEAFSKSI